MFSPEGLKNFILMPNGCSRCRMAPSRSPVSDLTRRWTVFTSPWPSQLALTTSTKGPLSWRLAVMSISSDGASAAVAGAASAATAPRARNPMTAALIERMLLPPLDAVGGRAIDRDLGQGRASLVPDQGF